MIIINVRRRVARGDASRPRKRGIMRMLPRETRRMTSIDATRIPARMRAAVGRDAPCLALARRAEGDDTLRCPME